LLVFCCARRPNAPDACGAVVESSCWMRAASAGRPTSDHLVVRAALDATAEAHAVRVSPCLS
jgi:hypothetical protein